MFESIYEQFLKFALNPNDEVECIVFDKVKELSKNQNIVSPKKLESEKISDIFIRNVQGYNILEFIESDPVDSLAWRFLEDTYVFIGIIRNNQQRDNIQEKNKAIYRKISTFVNMLYKYLNYLKKQMKEVNTYDNENPSCFYVHYELKNDNKEKFKEKTLNYRQKLKSLYDSIRSYKAKMKHK
jgi:hypothetical protein